MAQFAFRKAGTPVATATTSPEYLARYQDTLTGHIWVATGVSAPTDWVLDFTAESVVPVANGGTNSSTALSGSSIMVSNGTAVVQGGAGTSTTVLHGNAAGVPSYSAVDLAADVTGNLPVTNLNSGTSAGATTFWCGDGTWKTASAAGGGTVTSVGIAAPAEFAVSGSPVTSSGTLTLTKATQTANFVYAGPTTGAAAAPTFRALVAADVPAANLASSANGGVTGNLPVTNLNSGTSAGATTFWCGDGTWKTASAAGGGTVTSVAAAQGVETASGSAITSTGTIRESHIINAQVGTTYTFLNTDRGAHVTFSNAASIAVTLPQAGTTGFENGYVVYVENIGVGAVTITPTTSTINGAATLVLTSNVKAFLYSDGTNYRSITINPHGIAVNAQTGTTYTVLSGDASKLVTFTNASPVAVTLPQATGAFAKFWGWIENRGAGTLTITPTTSTIDGAASLALTTNQGCLIASDGTNYFTARGIGSTATGTVTSVNVAAAGTAGVTFSGGPVTTSGTITASANIGYLEVPSNSQSAAYTTVLADSGKGIDHPASDANARTFTIDSNANVAYPVGTCITFTNMAAQAVTIAITSDTMYLAGAGTTGSRTLAQYGVATARKILTTTWLISGTNLT